ncbi:uncharacterized protein ACLA_037400 [Aspergillus clavatus NRRL 1]|uniref:RRM domain-containing protein n=1 Tax=Aspergillus clavatus (strain ATCC 1007 / CBS 513.65 / DSM 816 / NCTC 3887 / NRRL 1 / QM 1276 / 107) TaxID=344612 RepID=A1CK59_ASPCL|nr:uncharacterized protein ACLA_037400 [Aspergillus clavatus NRRL 1]EAW09533.1 hypothetical protein ACLA_037400 [Aspergillus clavatus NRRL 1]
MIRDVFAAKGFLVDVHLPLDSESTKHAGFGYLHFPSIHAASAALDALQGTHIDGHSINLEFSDHSPIKTVRPEQYSEQTVAPEPSELQSSTIVPTETKLERVVESNDDREPPTTAIERWSVPLSVADLCSSERSAMQAPKGKEVLSTTPDGFPRLTRDSDHGPFPPVSQLDAHVLTNQRRDGESQRGQLSPGKRHLEHENGFSGQCFKVQSPPGSFPEDDSDETRPGPSSGPAKPRRSKSMRFSGQSETGSPAKPLRRRATERHSLRRESRNDQSGFHDMACAYDNYTTTFGNSPSRNVPQLQASATLLDGDVQQADARQRAIDECVTALVGLGYGSTSAGGYQRMAVYAAAADGRISDAIDLIEEERKVYEQHGSLI